MKKILNITFLLFIIVIHSQTMRLDSIAGENYYILYNYDANNINIGAEGFLKNSDDTWSKITESTLTYNSDNLVLYEIATELDGTIINNETKVEYTYNPDLSINTRTNYGWVSNQWQIDYIEDFQYLSGVVNEIFVLDSSNNYEKKLSYVYNNNILTKIKTYFWDNSTNDWQTNPWGKSEYSYDTDGNLVTETDYNDCDGDGVWTIGTNKMEYIYDNNYTNDNLILPFMYYLEFELATASTNHKVTNFEIFEASNSEWSTIGNYTYFYTDTTLSINELNNINYKVYPNPIKNQVNFEINDFEKITIYDISGKLILETKSNIVNMKNVQNGVYLYRIHKENKIINGKIIKE